MKKIKALLASITLSFLCAGCLLMAEQISPIHSISASAEEFVTTTTTSAAQETIMITTTTTSTTQTTNSGTCGENLTWNFETSTGTLIISGTGAMKNWDKYPDWYNLRKNIKKIIIEDGVTAIGDWAFAYCTALESITIPDSVTTIGRDAFRECKSLTSVTIPDSVTAIGSYAFYQCKSLTSITIPNSVTTIGDSAFSHTPWLETKQNENPLVIINGILIDGTTCKGEIIIPDSVTTIAGDARPIA